MMKLQTQDNFIFPFPKKGDVTRALLAAQGYKELEPIQKDLPNVSRDGFHTFLFMTFNLSHAFRYQICFCLYRPTKGSKSKGQYNLAFKYFPLWIK